MRIHLFNSKFIIGKLGFSLLSGIISTFYCLPAWSQWEQKEFIIGAFHDPKFEVVDNSNFYFNSVNQAREAYFNLFTDTRSTDLDAELYRTKFKILESAGISTLFNLNFGKNNFSKKLELIKNFRLDTTGVAGWYLVDEPPINYSDTLCKLVEYLQELYPDKLAYINLLPVYGFKSIGEYEKYLDKYLVNSPLRIISYDFYPFRSKYFAPNYYKNIHMLIERANGRPIWIHPLSTSREIYPDPGKYELYFMTLSPLTYGIKGIIYFTYETVVGHVNNYGNAILDPEGNPTSKYSIVKEINRFIRYLAGPIIMNSDYIGTFHVSNEPFRNETIDPGYLLNDRSPLISTISNSNIVSGIFKSKYDSTEYYLFMHNKDNKSYKKVYVNLKGDFENNISASTPVADFLPGKNPFIHVESSYDSDYNETGFFLDFEPGELRIIKITDVDVLIKNKPGYKTKFTVFPNPVDQEIVANFTLERDCSVYINLYGIDGSTKKQLLSNQYLNKGSHAAIYDLSDLQKGIYLISLVANGQSYMQKLLKL